MTKQKKPAIGGRFYRVAGELIPAEVYLKERSEGKKPTSKKTATRKKTR